MATNLVQKDGKYIQFAIAGKSSGDPVIKGDLTGVAITGTNAAGNVSVDTGPAVYDLSVKAVNNSGNSAVVVGDALYYVAGDTPVLSKKQTGVFYGYALEAINAGLTATINVLLGRGVIEADGNVLITAESFKVNPVTSAVGGGAASGTAANVMSFNGVNFEYEGKGTQTITAPSLAAGGLDIGMDQTDDDGVEITRGITARSPEAFVIGTSPAFYAKAELTIPDVSGTDDLAFGFRKAEAYQGNLDDYDEMACLNVISGDIKIETILNNGATTTTDTTDNWADTNKKTLEVYVSAAGVVTYKINGVAPTVTAAFTFDTNEVVIPFLFFLNSTDLAGSVLLSSWEVGYQ